MKGTEDEAEGGPHAVPSRARHIDAELLVAVHRGLQAVPAVDREPGTPERSRSEPPCDRTTLAGTEPAWPQRSSASALGSLAHRRP